MSTVNCLTWSGIFNTGVIEMGRRIKSPKFLKRKQAVGYTELMRQCSGSRELTEAWHTLLKECALYLRHFASIESLMRLKRVVSAIKILGAKMTAAGKDSDWAETLEKRGATAYLKFAVALTRADMAIDFVEEPVV